MIKAVEQCRDFCDLLVEGVKIQTTLTDDQWNNVFSNWLSSNYLAPSGVDFNIYKESTGNFIGFIEIEGADTLVIQRHKNGIRFVPLCELSVDLSFEQWCSVWLYDLRIQLSVAIFVKVLYQKINKINKQS